MSGKSNIKVSDLNIPTAEEENKIDNICSKN